MGSIQQVQISAMDCEVTGELLDEQFSYGDGGEGLLVKYSVSNQDFLAIFHPDTGDEISAGLKGPLFSAFAEPLSFDTSQLGNYNEEDIEAQ